MNIDKKYQQFYENIIFDQTNKDNYVEIRCFNPQGEIYSRYFQEPIELIRYIDKYKTTTNVYVGINPRKEQGRKNLEHNQRFNIRSDICALHFYSYFSNSTFDIKTPKKEVEKETNKRLDKYQNKELTFEELMKILLKK